MSTIHIILDQPEAAIRRLAEAVQRLADAHKRKSHESVAAKPASDLSRIRFPFGTTVDAAERELIWQTLAATGGNKTKAAKSLGISLKTLYNRLKEYNKGQQ